MGNIVKWEIYIVRNVCKVYLLCGKYVKIRKHNVK